MVQFNDSLYLVEAVADLRHLCGQQRLLCGQHLQVVGGRVHHQRLGALHGCFQCGNLFGIQAALFIRCLDFGERGVHFRAGTQVELYNALVSGKTPAIEVETELTETALADGTSVLSHVSLSGEVASELGIYTNDMFTEGEGNLTNQELPTTAVGTTEGGATPSDSFFESADYKGAISSDNDWTSGWTL